MNKISFLFKSLCIAVLLVSCESKIGKLEPKALPVPASACDSITWTKHIKPIIDFSCAKSGCHAATGPQSDLSTYSGVKARVDDGQFKFKVFDASGPGVMPKDAGKFPQSKLDSIKCWLDKGAPNN